ncbi:diguanylate cyclase (GGDEF) domain-containing protein [Actinopolyspora alba]|uniref:Diguanylate cyclase (GGDEF) domain-containing protein n=1 Tax=Actinopolyspora alba TaxID=673379 RepID=A0A1I1TNP0_9ACTN|nr:GGDEF domain-containing protein [Actinopolyspora alba]SFD60129.1 diguanylate cyclase (GGDEF) domain-containing protein [Actinopolyspora alba]
MQSPETEVGPAEDFTEHFDSIRSLARDGDNAGAIELADGIAAAATDPLVVCRALVLKLGRLFNLGRVQECPAVLDRAFGVLSERRAPALRGHLHALAGIIAASDSLERCVRHLVQAERELDTERGPTEDTVTARHDLAVTYSYLGFHAQAAPLAERCYRAGQALGLPSGDHALPEVAVRWAVSADHLGDTESCVDMLRRVLRTWADRTEPRRLWPAEQYYYGYAAVRLRALGERAEVDPALFTAEEHGWEVADLRMLAAACESIAEGDTAAALRGLDRPTSPYTLGSAEPHRLRALAHAADGNHRAAREADREAIRTATSGTGQLRDRLVDGTRAQLDHEALRRTVEQYASEALTDPLTGLPNRRHFDRYVARLTEEGSDAAVGVIDLDGFKAVNTVYGHLSGDLVLQRVAAILARTLRQGDFVARYGGDEFVAVLPRTDLSDAHRIGARIASAVADGDWDALVAGTPVSVTIGWADLTEPFGLSGTLETADRAMLSRKRANRETVAAETP